MVEITRLFIDTSKSLFQLHGVDGGENVVLRRQLTREAMVTFLRKLAPTTIGLEACGGSHYWARELSKFGHEVKLIAPQHVKRYVPRGKNDVNDAAAGCEAMSRPTMGFVPVKTADQQAALMLIGIRESIVRDRTDLSNTIRGYAAEYGIVVAKGMSKLEELLQRIAADETVPATARHLFAGLGARFADVQQRYAQIDADLHAWFRRNPVSVALAKIPGVGPIGASLLVMKTPDPGAFKSGRCFAAWLGLTPRDHSTAGKTRQGVITRAGDEILRSVLVVGATSVIKVEKRKLAAQTDRKAASGWLGDLLKRKPPKLAAVALANKIARIAWSMMATGEIYDPKRTTRSRRPPGWPRPLLQVPHEPATPADEITLAHKARPVPRQMERSVQGAFRSRRARVLRNPDHFAPGLGYRLSPTTSQLQGPVSTPRHTGLAADETEDQPTGSLPKGGC